MVRLGAVIVGVLLWASPAMSEPNKALCPPVPDHFQQNVVLRDSEEQKIPGGVKVLCSYYSDNYAHGQFEPTGIIARCPVGLRINSVGFSFGGVMESTRVLTASPHISDGNEEAHVAILVAPGIKIFSASATAVCR